MPTWIVVLGGIIVKIIDYFIKRREAENDAEALERKEAAEMAKKPTEWDETVKKL